MRNVKTYKVHASTRNMFVLHFSAKFLPTILYSFRWTKAAEGRKKAHTGNVKDNNQIDATLEEYEMEEMSCANQAHPSPFTMPRISGEILQRLQILYYDFKNHAVETDFEVNFPGMERIFTRKLFHLSKISSIKSIMGCILHFIAFFLITCFPYFFL